MPNLGSYLSVDSPLSVLFLFFAAFSAILIVVNSWKVELKILGQVLLYRKWSGCPPDSASTSGTSPATLARGTSRDSSKGTDVSGRSSSRMATDLSSSTITGRTAPNQLHDKRSCSWFDFYVLLVHLQAAQVFLVPLVLSRTKSNHPTKRFCRIKL